MDVAMRSVTQVVGAGGDQILSRRCPRRQSRRASRQLPKRFVLIQFDLGETEFGFAVIAQIADHAALLIDDRPGRAGEPQKRGGLAIRGCKMSDLIARQGGC